jgi:hypothetical protein
MGRPQVGRADLPPMEYSKSLRPELSVDRVNARGWQNLPRKLRSVMNAAAGISWQNDATPMGFDAAGRPGPCSFRFCTARDGENHHQGT